MSKSSEQGDRPGEKKTSRMERQNNPTLFRKTMADLPTVLQRRMKKQTCA